MGKRIIMASVEGIKLFGKWSFDDVEVNDIALMDYISVKPKHAQSLPHTAGRWQVKRFRKASCPIVERMTNAMMMHSRNTGKKLMAVRIIKHCFEIIHLLTDQNPIQVLLDAVGARNSAFRNVKTIAECLADEIINAAKGSSNSYAIEKKDETERVAKSNR